MSNDTQTARTTDSGSAWHTAGPWQYDFGDGGAVVYRDDAGTIANIPDDLNAHEANARLIAAAPELLAALDGIIEQYRLAMIGIGRNDDFVERNAALITARAALAKARGEV